jgi:hypothetical protein
MTYADYTYYIVDFMGGTVPEPEFAQYALRAAEYIDQLTFDRAKCAPKYKNELASAACAAAEVIYSAYRRMEEDKPRAAPEIKSETVGKYRIEYALPETRGTDYQTGSAHTQLMNAVRRAVERHIGHTGLMYQGIS